MWFKNIVGFEESSPEEVRNNLFIKKDMLFSRINNKSYQFGKLEIPTLENLRLTNTLNYDQSIKLSEIIDDIKNLHMDISNKNSLFQVASQFNLLEMASPDAIPEYGVDIYENDYTQGPTCAISCGAGTIFRNYFAIVNGKIGQTKNNQIDCLSELKKYLNLKSNHNWKLKNGYLFLDLRTLNYINSLIENLTESDYEKLKGKLKIGIQWNTEVTISNTRHTVSQAYCSAIPVAYSNISLESWKVFSKLILEASYEATFYSALKNYNKTGNNRLYLTLVGGGVFGNNIKWIINAIKKNILKFKKTPLDIKIVSYKTSKPEISKFISEIKKDLT